MDLQRQNSSSDDQHFLLKFIMGMYLGPDVTFDNPRRCAFQRVSEDSPPYTSSDLGSSYVSIALLENLYYYLLRKAHPSLRLKPNMLHKYLKGIEESWQFTRLFPLDLHEQMWYPASFRIVKGIVLIDDPNISSLEENDLIKFKSLSCISAFKIEMDELLHYEHEYQPRSNSEKNCMNGKETIMGGSSSGGDYLSLRSQHKLKRRRECDLPPMPPFPHFVPMEKYHSQEGDFQRSCIFDGQAIMSIRPLPDLEKCTSEPGASIVISGTARKGKGGPPVGVVDVGVSKDAYYFRVALPGVRKDYCNFSCEIESDGKVHVRGTMSGGKSIKKPLRIFEMKFQQLCPPGPFTLSFSLPGPVDPRLFAPNFRSDGIFEGVIIHHTTK
ncbi:increased DNA methylation 2-like isoform X2 [Humulus lupulus]|uniref:increased DNA methylation 2-like isoform X2 n=1 Tax=Humulus lupulus TaxID=3486 RepID=UPI002B40BCBC|nr:increased DNA methylation 2-like isoform X2 [Humulus lupulus]